MAGAVMHAIARDHPWTRECADCSRLPNTDQEIAALADGLEWSLGILDKVEAAWIESGTGDEDRKLAAEQFRETKAHHRESLKRLAK